MPPSDHKKILDHNRHAWNWAARNGNRWSIPVGEDTIAKSRQGELDIVLTPAKKIPPQWLGDVRGKKILGLASAGGQQGPVLAAAGAEVTILDLSPDQLAKDQQCSVDFGLNLTTIESDAAHLSTLRDASFDMIINPVSNCFFPDLAPVWQECARVLKPDGLLLYAFANPVNYLFDFEKANKGEYQLKYKSPYSDQVSLSEEEQKRFIYPEAPLEFGHSLTTQLGTLLQSGFTIEDMYEDGWDTPDGINNHYECFIAVKARRIR